MNIAVVDDEEIIRKQLKGLIDKQQAGFWKADFRKAGAAAYPLPLHMGY